MENKTLKTMEEAEINVVTFDETDIVATSGIASCAVDGGGTSDGCMADSCTSDIIPCYCNTES